MKVDKIRSVRFFASVKVRGIEINYLNVDEIKNKGLDMFYNYDIRQLVIIDHRENPGEKWPKLTLVGAENVPQMSPYSETGWWDMIETRQKKLTRETSVTEAHSLV
jgi:hypothetical protein